jgi:hypothetical protein
VATAAGLSLHADVAVPARDRKRLERLARYVARPPLASERLTKLDDGRLCYRLKHRWRDGTTHILLAPVALLERLAACIPPPRFHLVRYHGILASCASWRDHVVPNSPGRRLLESRDTRLRGSPEAEAELHRAPPSEPFDEDQERASGRERVCLGGVDAARAGPTESTPSTPMPLSNASRPRRLPWAALLQRVFAVDAFACPRCGARLRLLAAIESPEATRAILDCMGLPSRAPPLAPAEPDEVELEFEDLPLFDE